ncbi:MAG: hypothetical protein K0Q65_2122 [Clostridia bacterium]|jgi:hypothetical protein|nr:hypothetical protein [Clostridia bacterium]
MQVNVYYSNSRGRFVSLPLLIYLSYLKKMLILPMHPALLIITLWLYENTNNAADRILIFHGNK